MLLVIDIGNTNIVYGVYNRDKLLGSWRMTTNKKGTADEQGLFLYDVLALNDIDRKKIDGIIISSVVPSMMQSLKAMCKHYFHLEPMIVGPSIKSGIKILYKNPLEVGADRIVNAVAGYHKYGGPLILVDFGTATTFCALNEHGDYLGGAIATGVRVSTDALYQSAAKLPKVELEFPEEVLNRDTVSSMQAGILYGYVGQVEYIVNKMTKEMGYDKVTVVATGGLAPLIASKTEVINYVDDQLTLEGLKILYDKNKKQSV